MFISHPLALSLFALLLTVFIVPKKFSKHHLDLIRSDYEADIYRNSFYCDIDGDGINERILMRNLNTNANIVALTQNGSYVATWNLPGFWYTEPDYCFADLDKDGIEEIFCISHNPGDSVYVTQIELSDEADYKKSRYVCRLTKINNALDHIIKADGLVDVTGDSVPDFLFHISAGYSLQPRACYAWDLENDTVISNPFAGINIQGIHMENSKENSMDHSIRIFPHVTATDNYSFPINYSDTASYALVFTQNLQYLFEPLYTGGAQSNTVTLPYQYEGEDHILAVTNDKRKSKGKISLRVIDQMGNILASKNSIDLLKTLVPFIWNGEVYLQQRNDLEFSIFKVGPGLQIDKIFSGEGSFFIRKILDFDADGEDELLMTDGSGQAFAILKDDLESFTRVDLPEKISQVSSVSIKSMDQNHTEIFVQTQGNYYLLDFYANSFYPFRWTYYILLYLMYALVFVGLQKLFVLKGKKKKEIEDKIVNLQLQSVMNQLNPHFTFNAINSIGLAMMEGKSMEAYEYFVSLSDLIRKTMKNAFEPYKILAEEIEFVKQYLHIESYRFNGKLSWNFQQDPTVNVELIVPKMLIHIFVENAIKHGIFHNPEGGKIDISINKSSIGLLIMVTDDGVGMSKAFEIEKHRGDGLRILDNYLVLFNRQHKHSVSYNIIDCTNLKTGQTGTHVLITIKI
ncbi:MAG: histidine kinase [Bacteroidales bacterium]|nr:histidine kinase [Bacteroidales bacterium]